LNAAENVTSQCEVTSAESLSSANNGELGVCSSTDVDVPVCPSSLSTDPVINVSEDIVADANVISTMDESNSVIPAETVQMDTPNSPSSDDSPCTIESMQVDEFSDVVDSSVTVEDSEGTISTALNTSCIVQDSINSESVLNENNCAALVVDSQGIDIQPAGGVKINEEVAMVTEENHSVKQQDWSAEQQVSETFDGVDKRLQEQPDLSCAVDSTELMAKESVESIELPTQDVPVVSINDQNTSVDVRITCGETSVDVDEVLPSEDSVAVDTGASNIRNNVSSGRVEADFEVSNTSGNGLETATMAEGDSGDNSKCPKTGIRVHTASLNEVSGPTEEMVAHIGSTCIHVADELSVVNGIVKPVDSGVKIGMYAVQLRFVTCF